MASAKRAGEIGVCEELILGFEDLVCFWKDFWLFGEELRGGLFGGVFL